MQSKIPFAIREQLSEDPFMARCIFNNSTCEGRIEWQHAMTYAGRRVNELYTILPLCSKHHKEQGAYRSQQEAIMRQRIIHFHAEKDFAAKYPKSNLFTLKQQ